ncbi:hypothetical protein [Algoriphagus sp. A40]|uniref:hypothetical protein n=1 Tax=Algoriphagus sp. A40 TaxID=1945863 RepID=UPI00143A4324|nr:hypothetical protein [Algoriphagus sp. A40]
MKTFWKLILILWGITFSTSGAEEKTSAKPCVSCTAMVQKTTQTCDVVEAAQAHSIT